ncbi:MAG TPA: patatin-like phospholipase family protein [Nevskia sp.]|nr:patatin-like phospholipase family protein [Nevskia sp.]
MIRAAACLLACCLAACGAQEPRAGGFSTSVEAAPPAAPPRLGLALGGGAARGFAHVGVIKVLQSHGIEPDLVVGTSAGCMAGALYSAGYSGFDLQQMSFDLDRAAVADWSVFGNSLIKGDALHAFVDQAVKQVPMEKLKRRFACVAVKLRNGDAVLLDRGDVGDVVRASTAVPEVFAPMVIGGEPYVDGGLRAPVPIRQARAMGADLVIAVDVSSPPGALPDGRVATLKQTIAIMSMGLREYEAREADVMITPDLTGIGSTDFDDRMRAILAGERAAQAALPQIREKLAARGVVIGG